MVELENEIKQILEYATMAPNGHNTQPWSVKPLSGSEIMLLSDQSRWLTVVDSENRELMITMGAFWENLHQAAKSIGWDTEAQILASDPKSLEILKVSFSKEEAGDGNFLDVIERRAVNRHPYKDKELEQSHLDELNKLYSPDIHYFPCKSQEGGWIVQNLIDANQKQAMNDDAQKELSEWLRFSRSEVKEKGDGLTPEMLGLSGLARFAWYTFMNHESAMSESFRKRGVENAKHQAEKCSGFIVLTSEKQTVESLLKTGRQLENLAHKLTEMEISWQPMSQLLEEEPWKDQIKDKLKLDDLPQMVLRVGYTKNNPKVSIRRKMEEVIRS
jgi:nitroreductase